MPETPRARWKKIQQHLCDWYDGPFWKGFGEGASSQPWLRHLLWHMDFLGDFFVPRRGPAMNQHCSFLDVGGGYMLDVWSSLAMHQFYWRAIGTPDRYDVVEPEARFLIPGVVTHHQMMAEDILGTKALHGRFDHVLCLGALDHFIDPEKAIAGMVKAMVPGGSLWIGVTVGGTDEEDPYAMHQWTAEQLREFLGPSLERFELRRPIPMKPGVEIAYACVRGSE